MRFSIQREALLCVNVLWSEVLKVNEISRKPIVPQLRSMLIHFSEVVGHISIEFEMNVRVEIHTLEICARFGRTKLKGVSRLLYWKKCPVQMRRKRSDTQSRANPLGQLMLLTLPPSSFHFFPSSIHTLVYRSIKRSITQGLTSIFLNFILYFYSSPFFMLFLSFIFLAFCIVSQIS